MIDIVANLANTQQQIKQIQARQKVTLLVVGKTQATQKILTLYQAGQLDFAENYLQEALLKINALKTTNIIWHFIGSIQANKTKLIAQNFSWVHSVDRLKIAQRLNEQRPKNLPKLNICLQVNIDNETSKSGLSMQEIPELVKQCQTLDNIKLRGLMCIPKNNNSTNSFANMANIFKQQPNLDTLSMGMSADFVEAINHNSTMVRIGQGIFGKRD